MPKFSVSRSTEIKCSVAEVKDTVADFRTWPTWSPWLVQEPDTEISFSGEQGKPGAGYKWDGKLVGSGEMECLSIEDGVITNQIRFTKPFKSQSEVKFVFEESNGMTKVTWVMDGSMPWFLFWMIGMMRTYIGMDYERGLLMLKTLLEDGKVESKLTYEDQVQVGSQKVIGIHGRGTIGQFSQDMGQHFGKLKEVVEKQGLEVTGAPMSRYQTMSPGDRSFEYTSMIPVKDVDAVPDGVVVEEIPAFQALQATHKGNYEFLGNAWSGVMSYKRANKIKTRRKPVGYEVYVNDPNTVSKEELLTQVWLPRC